MSDIYPGNTAIGAAFSAGLTFVWQDYLRIQGDTDPAKATGVIPRIGATAADVGAAIHGALDAIGPGYDHTTFEAVTGPVASKFNDVFPAVFAGNFGQAHIAPRLGPVLAAVVSAQLTAELGSGAGYPGHDLMAAAISTSIWLVYCAFLRAVGLTAADVLLRTPGWDATDDSSPIWVAIAPYIVDPP